VLELKDVDFVRDGKLLLAGVSLTVASGERWSTSCLRVEGEGRSAPRALDDVVRLGGSGLLQAGVPEAGPGGVRAHGARLSGRGGFS
jgi:hypothetical protein